MIKVINMKETKIYLIRHSNQFRDFIYNYSNKDDNLKNENIILSVEGEINARDFSKKEELKNIDVIYSSNYARALSTAKYIAFNNQKSIHIDDRLGERKLRKNREFT